MKIIKKWYSIIIDINKYYNTYKIVNYMKILSFDIGIKNLAGCIMEKEGESYVIHWWDVLNLLQAEEKSCSFVKKNSFTMLFQSSNLKYFT